jgi:two-component system, chemotaxis family, chemotaxis protein CheY
VKEQVARLDQTFAGPRVKADRSKLRVLVVDDSRSARVNERQILNSLGFTNIIEADDGAQGLVAATNEPVDLIVTDYNMPLMDGYAMVSYLKQSDKTAKIPIIMVTTETAAAILDPVRKLGVVAIFEKAFPAASVGPVLDRLFG